PFLRWKGLLHFTKPSYTRSDAVAFKNKTLHIVILSASEKRSHRSKNDMDKSPIKQATTRIA
ncbi:hypothetical protein ACOV11_28565, partial [Vibrio natriegens]